jgi:hypothetical protein
MITVLRACGAFFATWLTLFLVTVMPSWAGAFTLSDVADPVWAAYTVIAILMGLFVLLNDD